MVASAAPRAQFEIKKPNITRMVDMRRTQAQAQVYPPELVESVTKRLDELRERHVHNMAPMLPLIFNWERRPFHLYNHFAFEPLFSTYLPKNLLLKCARQVGKSLQMATRMISLSATIPGFNTLFVTPMFEMTRRFSNNYVKPLINQSPMARYWRETGTSANVLQRSLPNGSTMHFSYAFTDADRTRGINAHFNLYDEIQDFDISFISVIQETMGASIYGPLNAYSGTAKTFGNTIQKLWNDSSKAEWVIKCQRCGYDNIAGMEYDLDQMMGPMRNGKSEYGQISEEQPALLCARSRCRRPIHPRFGRWWHAVPSKRMTDPGYHIPQAIMPDHCCKKDKWAELCSKREGRRGVPLYAFYNEVCGESYDQGARLLTESDLQAAATLHPNEISIARREIGKYRMRVCSVDWGGGGVKGDSLTVVTVLGLRDDGVIDVIYGHRSLTPHDRDGEAEFILKILVEFRCNFFVHDYNGAGSYREDYLLSNKFPLDRVMPVWYIRTASSNLMREYSETETHWRRHCKLDKPRSLHLTCQMIKQGKIKFFQWDNHGNDDRGLICDFLALLEDKVDTRMGREIYTIIKNANESDDFAQSVNMGCCFIWFKTGWPEIARTKQYDIDAELERYIHSLAEEQFDIPAEYDDPDAGYELVGQSGMVRF